LIGMTRIVGTQNRSEFERNPAEALRRGRALDAMLHSALPPHARGVVRGKHAVFNQIDDARSLSMAQRIANSR
jgi:hypothetical protein